jgi:hypothetical protein
VIAQAGPVSANLRTGDGLTTIHFDDPQNTCTQRASCLAAAFVTHKSGDRATCGGLELKAITETDIVFSNAIRSLDSKYDPGPCGGYSLEVIVAHEMGHALGLGHSTDPRALMAPWARFCRPYPPQKDDWAGIELLYGCALTRR